MPLDSWNHEDHSHSSFPETVASTANGTSDNAMVASSKTAGSSEAGSVSKGIASVSKGSKIPPPKIDKSPETLLKILKVSRFSPITKVSS